VRKETKILASADTIAELSRAVIRVVLYFDIFKYPLQAEEIYRACPCRTSLADVQSTLNHLVAQGMLAIDQGFYLRAGSEACATRRLKGNALATKRLVQAHRSARLIGNFPFVEAVMVSGSLSKHYMDPGSDIDFFIVTRPGRLWVARTLLVLYKKLVLFNSHKHFCVNYFVDTDHLEIEDKNLFTATETVFLLPMLNTVAYHDFRKANAWADGFFPNFGLQDSSACDPPRRGLLKRLGEGLLSGRLGDWADARSLRITLHRWQKKFGRLDPVRFEVALRSRRYVSKHHPQDFQSIVLGRLRDKQLAFEKEHGVNLGHSESHLGAANA
jgi:hypothetical protein